MLKKLQVLQSPFPNVQFPSAAFPYRDQVRLVRKLHTNYRLLEQLGFLQGLYFPNPHSVFLAAVGSSWGGCYGR